MDRFPQIELTSNLSRFALWTGSHKLRANSSLSFSPLCLPLSSLAILSNPLQSPAAPLIFSDLRHPLSASSPIIDQIIPAVFVFLSLHPLSTSSLIDDQIVSAVLGSGKPFLSSPCRVFIPDAAIAIVS